MSVKSIETVGGYEVHPAAALFPLMDDEEFAGLVADISLRGQIAPVITHEGKILDGRNRLLACEAAGVTPIVRQWDGTGGSPTAYAVTVNLRRRHLTQSQRAAIAAELIPVFAAEAAQRQAATLVTTPEEARTVRAATASANVRSPSRKASAEAAKAAGASTRATEQAARVMAAAPSLHEQVKAGEKSVHAAEKEVRNAERPDIPTVTAFRELAAAVARVGKVGRERGLYYSTGEAGPSLKEIEAVVRAGERAGLAKDLAVWATGPASAADLLAVVASIAQRISAEPEVAARTRASIAAETKADGAKRKTAAAKRPKRAMPQHVKQVKRLRK